MASFQAVLLKWFLKLDKLISGSAEELDIRKERIKLEKTAGMFRYSQDVQLKPVSIHDLPAEWIIPTDLVANRTILYFHGGSYNAGSIKTHRVLVANIASASKARLLIVDYRLAPEFPFPAAIEDAKLAYEWLLENGCSPNEVILVGDSAGGGLTLALLHSIKKSKLRMPAAAVCLSPWTDLSGRGESLTKNARKDILLNAENLRKSASIYIGTADVTDPLVSPIYANMEGFPALLIQVGSDELLLSDSSDFAEKAKAAGVDVSLEIWKDMQHVWQFAGGIVPESRQAIAAIGRFIENRYNIK
jgi:monoterpene epsilon-lactone hydrolase